MTKQAAWLRAVESEWNRKSILGKVLTETTFKQVMFVVSDESGVSQKKLKSDDRTQHLSLARHVVYYLLRKQGLGVTLIGKLMGKDHSTISHGSNKISKLRVVSKSFNQTVRTMEVRIKEALSG
jgi:chromosomal replication initiation ATPase DnaA